MPRPDAVIIPKSREQGSGKVGRALSMLDLADKYLEVDATKGEKAHMRNQYDGTEFGTRDPGCTLLYPFGHPNEKQPRYNWVAAKDDPEIRLGYLKADPTAETMITPSPVKPVENLTAVVVADDSASANS